MTWFTRNRFSLVALAVLLPAAFLVALSTDWWSYVEAETGRPIEVSGTETVDYAGARFSLLEWHSFDAQTDAGEDAGLLPGTTLVTAMIGVRPGDPAPFCDFELTDTDGSRSWPEASYPDADFTIDGSAESYCDSSAVGAYTVQVYFVVPDDAAENPKLALRVNDALPDFLLFLL